MLDPGQDAPARDAAANEAKGQIEAKGTLKNENVWGLRKMAYEINKHNEADYRWFRFEAPTELLEQLDHNLKIADGVLRFRIFKVDADTPVMAPPATSAPGPGASRERPSAPAAPAEAVAEDAAVEAPTAAPVAVAEPPAEPVAEEASEAPAEAEPAAETGEPEPTAAEPVAETPEPTAETPEPAPGAAEPEAPAEGEPGDSAA